MITLTLHVGISDPLCDQGEGQTQGRVREPRRGLGSGRVVDVRGSAGTRAPPGAAGEPAAGCVGKSSWIAQKVRSRL